VRGVPGRAQHTLCCACVTSHLRVKEVRWKVARRVWGARHDGAACWLVMQHCGIAAGVTRLGSPPREALHTVALRDVR
jgi:hypothetical protein